MSYQYKTGIPREQGMLLPPRVDEYVSEDNTVRAIDAYVESLDLAQLGFQHTVGGGGAGQPPYAPETLLKLYIWGYLNRTRSSRRLEVETYRNLEVIWLLQNLHPCYKTIANFRKDNPTALKAVYKDFLLVCRELDLFGGTLVGIDSMFLEGDASKASIYTEKRLNTLLARLDDKITAYLALLDQSDQAGQDLAAEDDAVSEKLKALQTRQHTYRGLLEDLQASEETQISCTDADARLLNKKTDKGPTAGYNVQCAIDSKHKLIAACDVVNDGNDSHQLTSMARQAKEHLEVDELAAAADTSYYAHQELKDCEDAGITVYVPEPDSEAATRKHGRFPREKFTYDAQANVYRCPAAQELTLRGSRQQDGKKKYQYCSSIKVCAECPLRTQCVTEKSGFRTIYRWEHEEVVERHRQRMQAEGSRYMRLRAGLAEHPFGTLKVWCGWTHFLVRGFTKVRGEFHLLATCYNFKRVLNILGIEAFRAYCHQRQVLAITQP
jgi:transposase